MTDIDNRYRCRDDGGSPLKPENIIGETRFQ